MKKNSILEELFDQFNAILSPWLEGEEFFAAMLLQTAMKRRGEGLEMAIDLGSTAPHVMHEDIAAIARHAINYPNASNEITFVFVYFPKLLQLPTHDTDKNHTRIDVLFAQFQTERSLLGD